MAFVTETDKIAFIQSTFGKVEIHRDGVNVSVRCPNKECPTHPVAAGKKKFCIRLDDDRAHCWVCGIGGRLAKILRLYVGKEALSGYVGKTSNLLNLETEEAVANIPKDFKMLGPVLGTFSPGTNSFVRYLYDRGLTNADIWHFKFGVSDEPNWKNRIIMPSFDRVGNLNWLTGRTIVQGARPKYIDHDGNKATIVFNEFHIDWTRELTIVEGPFDLVKCDDNATCLLGSNFSEKSRLFEMIVQHNTPVVLALDADVKKKAGRIASMLSKFDVDVKMLDTGNFHDVGEMTRAQFLSAKSCASTWTWNSSMIAKINTICSTPILGSVR